jgi:hypothetical protein
MKRRRKLINKDLKPFKFDILRITRHISLLSKIGPFCGTQRRECPSFLNTSVGGIALIGEIAYYEGETFIIDFEQLLDPPFRLTDSIASSRSYTLSGSMTGIFSQLFAKGNRTK